MKTVLHKQGDQFAIVTTAENEDEFRSQFTEALAEMIEDGVHDGDWKFQLEGWLAPATEIICKHRGYKAAVTERRTMIAGDIDPDAAVISIGRGDDLEAAVAETVTA